MVEKLAIDIMGGDLAPREVIKGVTTFLQTEGLVNLFLVGDKKQAEQIFKELGWDDFSRLELVHTIDNVGMADYPVESAKKKHFSSIRKGVELLSSGEAQGFVSAGNTGAIVAEFILNGRLLPSVDRPGIAVALPTKLKNKYCILIDAGANLDCKPLNILQYAVMGSIFYEVIFSKQQAARVGLLNIGKESGKGNILLKKSEKLLRTYCENFCGNVEGIDIFTGEYDVVVCDGFVGNIAIKTAEGCAEALVSTIKNYVKELPLSKNGTNDLKQLLGMVVSAVEKVFDYREYGGSPLIGIQDICVMAHGRSDSVAISNAIKKAHRLVQVELNDKMREALLNLDKRMIVNSE